jgi:O-antigen ligase
VERSDPIADFGLRISDWKRVLVFMFRTIASRLSFVLMLVAFVLAATLATSLEVTASGLVVTVLALATLAAAWRPARSWGWAGWCVAMAMAFAAWRMSVSPVADLARRDALLLAAGGLVFAWTACFAPQAHRRWWLHGVMVIALAGVGIGIYQAAGHPEFTPIFSGRRSPLYAAGFYSHYNHFANFMLGAGFLAAGRLLHAGETRRMRWLSAGVAVACLAGVVVSQSRGAFVALGVGTLVLAGAWLLDLKRRGSARFQGLLLGGVVLAPVLAAGWWFAANHLLEGRKSKPDSALMSDPDERAHYFSFGLEQALDHPVAGAGSRSYSYEYLHYWKNSELWRTGSDIQFAHNEFLQTAADYGFVGLGLLIVALMAVFAKGVVSLAMEHEKGSTPDSGELLGALAAIAAMLTQSMFSFVFHMTPDVMVLGAALGMICAQHGPLGVVGAEWATGWRRVAGGVIFAAFGLTALLLSARDAVAWWVIGRPGAVASGSSSEVRYATWKKAEALRPDYRFASEATVLAMDLAATVEPASREVWAKTALADAEAALARHPKDPQLRLRVALMLDGFSRFDEAEEHFRQLVPTLDVKGGFLNIRFRYGSHCYRRAYALWRNRQPEKALAWAIEGRRQMELDRQRRWFRPDSPDGKEMAALEQFIRWLEGAQIKPAKIDATL